MACLDTDFNRLRAVVEKADPAGRVPSCPDWTVADLARHVGVVYLHKVESMRLGTQPEPWPPAGVNEEGPVALLDRSHAALTAAFAVRAPDSPAHTWYGPDQTVGFWIRRMAHETAIHRVDAELGGGEPVTAVPDDLAHDGIAELLDIFVAYGSRAWPEEYAGALAAANARAIRVETPEETWSVRPTPEAVEVRSSDPDPVDAVVRGTPSELLLWLWNRAGDEAVTTDGDVTAVAALRQLLVVSTQ
jgi:uncharacterized protein (TIGR03083 family)